MYKTLLVGLGGAIGSVARYWVSTSSYALLGRAFPYGTLVVNIIGSFLMGFLFILLLERFAQLAEQLRALLLIGFLGGFTTFSSFAIETLVLFESGESWRAILNIVFSCLFCLIAVWSGAQLGRHL